MKVLLLANQPERTTRLKLFESTLKGLGYDVNVPSFNTRNWIKIAREVRSIIKSTRPDVVHIFNVPDIIYHKLPSLKREYYDYLIYDYRSPWGVETQMRFGRSGRLFCEGFEKELASNADIITTVNGPLRDKVRCYTSHVDVNVIPNYPSKSFQKGVTPSSGPGEAVIFVGRVCEQEGVGNLIKLAKQNPNEEFWIVGGGPFAWWYLMKKPPNLVDLGWQPHQKVAELVSSAKLCIIPRDENVLTPYSTDRSIWKLNEYLNLGRPVLASGITREEDRLNLWVVDSKKLSSSLKESLSLGAKSMSSSDYRFWDGNTERIRNVYESLS